MRNRLVTIAITVATMSVAGLAAAMSAGAADAPVTAGHNPGVVGKRVTLASNLSFGDGPVDVAADDSGTAYIGWISASTSNTTLRVVHLCVLPTGANSCRGGVQKFNALDGPSAADLRVLSTPSGHVTLLWFHDTANSGTESEGSEIAEVTTVRGTNPSAPADVAPAPSHGALLDAEYAPNGKIWLVTNTALPAKKVQVTPGIGAKFTTATAPWSVSGGQLAFTGGKPVLAVDKDAAVSEHADFATGTPTGSFGSFKAAKHTWTNALSVLKNTPHGLRLIAGADDASYRSVIAKWTGHGFGKPTETADKCLSSSHDASRDSSGRLIDVTSECDGIGVADYADDTHSAVFHLAADTTKTTLTGIPQVASGVRGIATVVWSAQVSGRTGNVLYVNRVALPDTTTTVHKSGKAGKVNLIGPTSCLPPVLVHVKVGASPSHGWSVASRTLTLGSKTVHGRRIDGGSLTPGKSYTLNGKVVFKNGHKHSTIKASLKFTTCAKG